MSGMKLKAPPSKKSKKERDKLAIDSVFENVEWSGLPDEKRDELMALLSQSTTTTTTASTEKLPKWLLIGANTISKIIENPKHEEEEEKKGKNKKIKCVVVCENVQPKVIIEHLIVSSAVNQIPVCVIKATSSELGRVLNIPSVIAFAVTDDGFAADSSNSQKLQTLVDLIISNASTIKVPWQNNPQKHRELQIEYQKPKRPQKK